MSEKSLPSDPLDPNKPISGFGWGNTEGVLVPFKGERPPAPDWFHRAVAATPESAFVEVDGTPVHYLRWGDKTKPGILLAHGNGAHAYWWSFIAPYLAQDYNVAALDFSGMGDSGWRKEYVMEQFVRDQIGVCEASGMFEPSEPPIIIGHSFGGFVTILTGAMEGHRLAGTVIIDSPVNPPERQKGPPTREPKPHFVYPTLAAALARFRLMPPQPCENLFLVDRVGRHSLKEVEGGFSWKFDPGIWQRFKIGNVAELLQETKCRIAIFRGDESRLLPPEVGAYMFSLLGHAAPVVGIPEARHHVPLDQPLALVAALRALLADWNHSVATRQV